MAALDIHQIPVWDDNYVYLAHDPVLRADDAGVAAAVGMSGGDPAAVFAEVRCRKDRF